MVFSKDMNEQIERREKMFGDVVIGVAKTKNQEQVMLKRRRFGGGKKQQSEEVGK